MYKVIEKARLQKWIDLEPQWQNVFAWVEATLDGRIVNHRRQARWRPCWFIDVQLADGTIRQVYVRCQREEDLPWTRKLSLEREYRILSVLQEESVLIPHIIGFLPDPGAILMDVVEGRDRFDERDDEETRNSVLNHYMEILASAHRIDPAKFAAAGLRLPETPLEIGYGGFQKSEAWYRNVKTTPQPVTEFLVKWLHRHVPTHRNRVSWNAWDAGQFLHQNGRCTALMDVEFSMLGDPLNDLAAMRFRDSMQGIGNLTSAYGRYAEVIGEPLDKSVINFQAVRFATITAMLAVGELLDPKPEFDVAQWASWSLVSQRVAIAVIAEELGIHLEDEEAMPAFDPSRRRFLLLSPTRILDNVESGLPEDDFVRYRLKTARELVDVALRADGIAAELERRDREDEARLLGRPTESWQEGDRLIEEYVAVAGPEKDAELVRFFHRRLQRERLILQPAMREMKNLPVQSIDWKALGFGGK